MEQERNSYEIDLKEVKFRRAKLTDNLEEIAELIYRTDPYIYPFWFNRSIDEAKKFLPELLKKEGNLFNINNIYTAYDKVSGKIVGILIAVDKSIKFTHDYDEIKKINDRYKFTIEHYVEEIEKEIEESENHNLIYISNVCVSEELRGKKIGSRLIGFFISLMEKNGYDVFALDCLLHNLRAKNLYHSMGFKEMKEIIGFDGTDHSKVEVVSFLRKKGNYYPEEFQVNYLNNRIILNVPEENK